MRVKTLIISNLRNISTTEIEPHPCLNCFVGENGGGKTSILEALVVLSKGRSFRSGQMSSLIGPESDNFRVIGCIETDTGVSHNLGMERGVDYWTARHNHEDVTQLSELTQLLPYVLLEPSSHTLVSGPPDGRRKYLDWGVFHVEHSFLILWRRYNRVLKQRNAALRLSNDSVVESLDPQLIGLGEQLHSSRRDHARILSELLAEILPVFSEALQNVNISYRKGWTGDGLSEAISAANRRDRERGSTGPGPHKADLYLTLDGVPVKERLSTGEQKSLTSAMIMAQARMICDSGEKPLLLLDDIASEFDEEHFERVLTAGIDLGVQIWLTGTALMPAVMSLSGRSSLFHVKHGQVFKTPEKIEKTGI